jgi:tight adherence protein C
MTHGPSLLYVALYFSAFLLFVALVIGLLVRLEWQRRYQARVASLHRGTSDVFPGAEDLAWSSGESPYAGGSAERPNGDSGDEFVAAISIFGNWVMRSGLLSTQSLNELRETLRLTGYRHRNAVALLVGTKLLLFVLLPLVVWLGLLALGAGASLTFYAPIAAAAVGLLGPDVAIRALRRRHLMVLESGIADALDMLVICSQAGLSLEPALERVGREISFAHPAVAREFEQTSQDMRVNADRRSALILLGKRTGLESLRRLSATLVQTMQYGTPLSEALRMLAAEHRTEALNRFETRAGRLSVMLTLPMICFILPCLFMVVGGPAIVQMLHAFHR